MNRLKFLSILGSTIIFLGALGYSVSARATESAGLKTYDMGTGQWGCSCPGQQNTCSCEW